MAPDNLDVSLVDRELLAELELTVGLIVAAAESDGPIAEDVLDQLLFVDVTHEASHRTTPAADLPHQPSWR
jgi:hypothetical protein